MEITRLIRRIEDVTAKIIGEYRHVVISVPPHNFEKLSKIEKELWFLLSQGKEYSLNTERTKKGIEYINCLRTN